jgi:cytochrome c biogenesis protein CcdA/thiol-disulfide isomerase/thioredoxin
MDKISLGLAFIEGIALTFSPCILPVLPLILSGSLTGGRSRPWGIILGFVLAFSLFSFFSRVIILSTGLDLDTIKNASLILLAGFGLVLLSERLSEKFSSATQRFANWGDTLSSRHESGDFVSGVSLGVLIGLIWTPCAGPILAAVLVQIIQQKTNTEGLVTLFVFSLGVGIPMGLIAVMGRSIMDRLSFVKQHAVGIRKGLGIIILASVALNAKGAFLWKNGASIFKGGDMSQVKGLLNGLDKPYDAPELSGISRWLNSPPLTIKDLKGKVVLVDFWTYSCVNCIRTLPYMVNLHKQYHDQGLVILGIHAPEFEFEKKVDNIQNALTRFGILYPVAVDNDLLTWSQFHNQFWPAHYLINSSGQVVYTHFGEGEYDITEHNIQYLLGLPFKQSNMTTESTGMIDQTPETYLGSARRERFAGTAKEGEWALSLHQWQLNDLWDIFPEFIRSKPGIAQLKLQFKAQKVFLVLGNGSDKPIQVTVKLNGQPLKTSTTGKDAVNSIITVNQHRLYELIDQGSPSQGLLELETSDPGLEAYAFTFG